MYHSIVERIATKNFERVNDHDYDALLQDCAPNIHHRFGGHHALGGERHDRETLRRWFQRLGRLCPTLKLTVHDVWVKGWPGALPRHSRGVQQESQSKQKPDYKIRYGRWEAFWPCFGEQTATGPSAYTSRTALLTQRSAVRSTNHLVTKRE